MVDHKEHFPNLTRAQATERELEELHEVVAQIDARLELVTQQLSLCVELLESIRDSQV